MNMVMAFAISGCLPLIAQVTVVALPFGSSVNSTALSQAIGLVITSRIATLRGGAVSVISIRPVPDFLPAKSCAAPMPLPGPR